MILRQLDTVGEASQVMQTSPGAWQIDHPQSSPHQPGGDYSLFAGVQTKLAQPQAWWLQAEVQKSANRTQASIRLG